jgi:hypothetical protein
MLGITQLGECADFYIFLFGFVYLALSDFVVDQTACVHQIVCKFWKKCNGVFECQARFWAGRTSTENDQNTGMPISSTTLDTVAKLQQLVREVQH